MISYIKGQLEEIEDDSVIVECNQIGYQIWVSEFVIANLPPIGTVIKLYTYLHVKEDGIRLFGFLSKDDLQVFRLLIGVSGVGPKGALAILSAMTTDDLRIAVSAQDAKSISKAQGVGLKTAQRIIIDLKDKLRLEDLFSDEMSHQSDSLSVPLGNQLIYDTIEALVSLGYSSHEASLAVKQISAETCGTVENCIKEALKKMVY